MQEYDNPNGFSLNMNKFKNIENKVIKQYLAIKKKINLLENINLLIDKYNRLLSAFIDNKKEINVLSDIRFEAFQNIKRLKGKIINGLIRYILFSLAYAFLILFEHYIYIYNTDIFSSPLLINLSASLLFLIGIPFIILQIEVIRDSFDFIKTQLKYIINGWLYLNIFLMPFLIIFAVIAFTIQIVLVLLVLVYSYRYYANMKKDYENSIQYKLSVFKELLDTIASSSKASSFADLISNCNNILEKIQQKVDKYIRSNTVIYELLETCKDVKDLTGKEKAELIINDMERLPSYKVLADYAQAVVKGVEYLVKTNFVAAERRFLMASTLLSKHFKDFSDVIINYSYIDPSDLGVSLASSILEFSGKASRALSLREDIEDVFAKAVKLKYKIIGLGVLSSNLYTDLVDAWLEVLEEATKRERVGVEEERVVEPSSVKALTVNGLRQGDIWVFLAKPLQGVTAFSENDIVEGEWHTVVLSPNAAPKGFEGKWFVARLGCGGWGCAFLAKRRDEKVVFKVPKGFEHVLEKNIRGNSTVSVPLLRKIEKRAEAVMKLRHPHVLRLLGYSRQLPILVYEYADGGTLEDQLASGWEPRLEDILLVGLQLSDALRYIHSRGLIHGDVKTSNVFVVNGVAKLGDFSGLTSLFSSASSVFKVYTLGWRAPEQVFSDLRVKSIEKGVENRVDVYQLGNLLLYLAIGETVDGEERANTAEFEAVLSNIGHDGLKKAIKAMMEFEPWKRISAEEALKMLALINMERKTLRKDTANASE